MPQDWFAQYAVRPSAPPPHEDDWFSQFSAPARRTHRTEDYMEPEDERSAASRFGSNLWEMVNPVTIAKGVYETVRHPIDTGKAIIGGLEEQRQKGRDAFQEGRYAEAVGHTAAGVLPVIGPLAAEVGEQIGSGDIAGGLGKATGILAPVGGARAAVNATKHATRVIPKRAATRLEAAAAERVADVMSPKASNQAARRMGNKAADKVAPELAKDADVISAWSREGLHANVTAKFDEAKAALDAASDARLAARTFDTQPIIDDLIKERSKWTAHAVEASKPTRDVTTRASSILDERGKPIHVTEAKATPVGRDVVPEPNQPRVARIDQAIAEIKELGPVARYEDLRRIRQAYDGPASVRYNPSMTDDFLKKTGDASGAADVTGTLREHLAKFDPETAAANAPFSLYKSANDIMQAAKEIERVKPKVGRQIAARIFGTVFGSQQAGAAGAVAGYALGPIFDQFANAGFTTKLQTAKLMSELAAAIRKGDVGRVTSTEFKLRKLIKPAAISTAQATQRPSLQPSRP